MKSTRVEVNLKNILVVDDSKLVLELLKRKVLASGRYSFFGAASYTECQKMLEGGNFFAAIVDLELPDCNSGDAVELTLNAKIPTVVLTGTMDIALRDKILHLPIVDYIQKDSLESMSQAVTLISKLDYFRTKTVLVVDDSTTSSSHIAEQFERLLFNTVISSDPREVCDILQKNKNIAVVMLDFEMPHMNGVELAKKIRSEFKGRDLLLFGISSNTSEEVKYRFLKSGITSFFTKPLIREEFVTKVVNHMRLFEQKENLESYINKVDKYVIISVTDKNGVIKYVSEAFCKISGYKKEELIGKKHNIVRHPDMKQSVYEELWTTISSGKSWRGEIKNRKKDGGHYWVNAYIEPIFNWDGEIIGYQAIRQDITDKKTIELMSITDELSGLFNRRHFNTELPFALKKLEEKGGSFGFFVMDVDNFKKYNDTYGHKMGDDVIKAVGRVLGELVSADGNIPFRLGGEEFGAIVAAGSKEELYNIANAVRESIEALHIEHSKNTASPYVTASFGAFFVDRTMDADAVYIAADEALYRAKEGGRNRIEMN